MQTLIRRGDVLRGPNTGDLYLVLNKYKSGTFRLKKLWINPGHPVTRMQKLGSCDYFHRRDAENMTLVGRNYREKAE